MLGKLGKRCMCPDCFTWTAAQLAVDIYPETPEERANYAKHQTLGGITTS